MKTSPATEPETGCAIPPHLTYCLNIHPGEAWSENLAAIKTHTLAIRNQVSSGRTFGLGMRLSHQAALTLGQPTPLAEFKSYLKAQDLYAFTINGFPYGAFHGKPVKEAVYLPDWSTVERLDYTLRLARILAELLPEGMDGSISTLPLGYTFNPARNKADAVSRMMITHLAECARALHELHRTTGREIHIGLEPEPDCLLETTPDIIRFFEMDLCRQGVDHLAARLGYSRQESDRIMRRHIGVCFDTCHLALQFEDLATSLGHLERHSIRISKIQLSAALEAVPTPATRERLKAFLDPVYLHQVKILQGITRSRHTDLDEALAAPQERDPSQTIWRIHFHVPLYFEGDPLIRTTSGELNGPFWALVATHPEWHLEIETYTFHVLPPSLRQGGVVASTIREFNWLTDRYAGIRS